jgi:hypothetical protein
MKKITTLLAALAVALPVYAQQPAKPAAPAQQPAKAEAPKPATTPEAPKPATMAEAPKAPKAAKKNTPSRRTEDARQCLEKDSNTDIIKCAEEYL